MKSVLIANRGEIAIRIARACKDHGLISIAIYSDEDRNSLHVESADEAYSLDGVTGAETYLNAKKIISIAKKSGADAIHPGYGFLSENADFAEAVITAGLIWIGPPPSAIRALGDKVSARKIAAKVGAPQVAGTADPVETADEIIAFAKEHGLPVAIKAVHGGGGRGLKVARTLEEIPELFASAVREAISGFGRGECFVERYLDKPRHVETQVLVDTHANAIVVSTRDCSLQRRHQKLVEEAPAPFLSAEQIEELYRSSKAIMKEAGYIGAGTCEFLVGIDGTISFLEVNTRLQVEHPVSEEVAGIDLVREQFRIRVDAGFREGDLIGGSFDSLLAKLIVTGSTRLEVIERARRALAEFHVEGLATALPFHRAILEDTSFTEKFAVHTRYIETEFVNEIPPYKTGISPLISAGTPEKLITEVDGHRFEVLVYPTAPLQKRHRARSGVTGIVTGDGLVSPMQGTVVKIAVAHGDRVETGDLIMVLEAMKMEQPLTAHKSGTIRDITAIVGQAVTSGMKLCVIVDE